MRFLMRQESPGPEVIAAIDAAADWLRETQLTGIRVARVAAEPEEFPRHRVDFDVVVEPDDAAPPIWARHYEIGSNRPIFLGRDAVVRYALADIERERRTGTAWYGNWPLKMLERELPLWRETHARQATQ